MSVMRVTKRDGSQEPVDLNKILKAIRRHCTDLNFVDPMRVAQKTINGLYEGAATRELDKLSIQTASTLVSEEPEYSKLAARILSTFIDKEVGNQDIDSFQDSISRGHELGLINDRTFKFVRSNKRKLNSAIDISRNNNFEYFGLKTVYDRYLLKHHSTRQVIETPQYFFMRVAVALSQSIEEAIELYNAFSNFDYMPSTPTLFNSGTNKEQLSSCYLLDSPEDDLSAIYDKYKDVALLSKFSGGIGVAYSKVRSRGSLIKGTNGNSNGLVPWLKTLDSSVNSVNQCFAPSTLVFTAEGPKPISSIKVNDLVLGLSGTYQKVTETFKYHQKDSMVEVKVKHSLTPTQVTSGHPFRAILGAPIGSNSELTLKRLQAGKYSESWVEAGDLHKGDYIAQVIPQEIVPVEGFTEEDARLYGILLGDGHLSKDGLEFGVSGNPQKDEHLQFVKDYLTSRSIHYWVTYREGEPTYCQIKWSAGFEVTNSPIDGRFIRKGLGHLQVSYSDLYNEEGYKYISRKFSHLPLSQTRAIIQGLLETDGCVSRGVEITFTNTSMPLAEGIRYQLLRLGVPSAGQLRLRDITHEAKRSSGQTIQFNGLTLCYDVRIPAVEGIAELVGCKPLRKKNWFVHNNCVWSRVRSVKPIQSVPVVHDLKVDGDETYMTTSALVHNGGKRKGACCVYLETWHADIEEFLELRDNTGDEAARTHNLNLANWIPDLFMERVDADQDWSLFDPKEVPMLSETFGVTFRSIYEEAERSGLAKRTIKARDLYGKMMKTLAETGNGWMTFKDSCNLKSNQTKDVLNSPIIHSSNLCTEITEVSSESETAVCNLASINLSKYVVEGKFDFDKLAKIVPIAVKQLDRVIDINFYPIESAKNSNTKWRPVGLGLMGLQDVFFQMGLPFDSLPAKELSQKISEEIYYHALSTSCDLAEKYGKHPNFEETQAKDGILQFDLWGQPKTDERWVALKERIKLHGLRNSLLIAIAPTATIASIVGCYECIEPQVSNLFKRETLSGDFLQINKYLVSELKKLNLWTDEVRDQIKLGDGSIQNISSIPNDLKLIYRTVWETSQRSLVDMAADRGVYIDQSQSLNLFISSPKIGQLSSMYFHAWKRGIKTTYYLRSRPATSITKVTVSMEPTAGISQADSAAIVCSLENPESCEACQ